MAEAVAHRYGLLQPIPSDTDIRDLRLAVQRRVRRVSELSHGVERGGDDGPAAFEGASRKRGSGRRATWRRRAEQSVSRDGASAVFV